MRADGEAAVLQSNGRAVTLARAPGASELPRFLAVPKVSQQTA